MKRLSLIILILLCSKAHAEIVCIGDSITRSTPYVELGEGYCELLGGINKGIGGQTAAQGLARFKSDVLANDPDTVIIEFGANDADLGVSLTSFKRDIKAMIRLSGKRKVILMTPPPYNDGARYNLLLVPFVQTLRQIAERNPRITLVDAYQDFAELNLIDPIVNYQTDNIHLNRLGHEFLVSKINKGNR